MVAWSPEISPFFYLMGASAMRIIVDEEDTFKGDGSTPVKSNNSTENQRRLIHVDFSVLRSDDDEDEDEDEEEEDIEEVKAAEENNQSKNGSKKQLYENPYMRTGIPKQNEYRHRGDGALELYDLATQCPTIRKSIRRHTFVPSCRSPDSFGRRTSSVLQSGSESRTGSRTGSRAGSRPCSRQSEADVIEIPSPGSEESSNLASVLPEMSWSRTSLQEDLFQSKTWAEECLSLTLEEIVHIRSVLTKAELEALPVDGHVKEDVEKRKVCFLCLKTRFSIFGPWGQKCRLCKRTICARCYSKMRIPTEHFAYVPVVALSPSLLNPNSDEDSDGFSRPVTPKLQSQEFRNSVGSAPSSPRFGRGKSVSAPGSRVEYRIGDGPLSLPAPSPSPSVSERKIRITKLADPAAEKLKGLEMTVCHDCKAMVIQIIKSSRTSRSNAIKNLTLNLSRVY